MSAATNFVQTLMESAMGNNSKGNKCPRKWINDINKLINSFIELTFHVLDGDSSLSTSSGENKHPMIITIHISDEQPMQTLVSYLSKKLVSTESKIIIDRKFRMFRFDNVNNPKIHVPLKHLKYRRKENLVLCSISYTTLSKLKSIDEFRKLGYVGSDSTVEQTDEQAAEIICYNPMSFDNLKQHMMSTD